MGETRHSNWIGGEWRPAESELDFELARGPVAERERWPRSNAADVRAALEACAYAAGRWSALRREARREVLLRAADRLEVGAACEARVAQSLGLREGELAPRQRAELYRLREALELLADGDEAQGVGLFQAHWSDLAAGLLMRLSARLVAGQTAIVLGDAHLPAAAECVARALEAAGLPRGVVALVHDDTDASLHAAATSPGLAWVRLKGHDARLDHLRTRLGAWLTPRWTLWPVRCGSHVVADDADPAAEAALAVEQSLARGATLSAQFPGQTARILCPERLFSKFTVELLAQLEASPDARDPLPALEADLDGWVRAAWELGLDEGATPLAGWELAPATRARARATALDAVAQPWNRGWPCVFTNVEGHTRVCRLTRPAPLLRLIRVPSAEVGRALAGQPAWDSGAPQTTT